MYRQGAWGATDSRARIEGLDYVACISMFPTLTQILRDRDRHTVSRPGQAAVLVPIIDDAEGVRLLLTRRTDTVRSHKGQVAFPGGFVEPTDADVVQAALREAHEEVALPPDRVEVLGLLDEFPTVTDTVAVTPVVGRVTELPPLVAQPDEVARIFSVPLTALRVPDAWRMEMVTKNGVTWPLYFFEWDGETLWGLSAYITLHLLDLVGEAPFDVPAVRVR